MAMMVGTLHDIKRLKSSAMGNPKYRFTFAAGEHYDSASNAGFAYAVDSSWIGKEVAYNVTGRGTIDNMRLAQEGDKSGVPWTHRNPFKR